LYCSNTVDFY
jgi:3'-phosphoadenosine 5'-phosphosulfate synthase